MAAKCTLAARVDSFHESPEGEAGQGIVRACNIRIGVREVSPTGELSGNFITRYMQNRISHAFFTNFACSTVTQVKERVTIM